MRGGEASGGRLGRLLANPELRDAVLAIANQVLVSGTTFLIGIAAARLLGIEQFGRFAMVLILAAIMQAFQNAYLLMPMLTLVGARAARLKVYYTGIMASNVLLSVAAGLIVTGGFAIGFGWRDGAVPWSFVTAAGAYTAAQNYLYTVRRMMFARREAMAALWLDISRYGLLFAMLAAVWWSRAAIDLVALLWALTLSALVVVVPYTRKVGVARADRRLLRTIMGRHWPAARWLLPMTVITFLQDQAITLGIGFYLSDEAVGGLRAGQYLLGITHFITMGIDNVVPGGAARALAAGGRVELRRYLLARTVMFAVPVCGLILVLAFNAETALRLAFGPAYAQFAPLLHIFAASYVCIYVRDMGTQYFRAIERTDAVFRAFVVSALVAGLLAVPVLVPYGVTGAALLILATNVVSMLYVLWRLVADARGA